MNGDASVRSSGGQLLDGTWNGKPNPGYLTEAREGALFYDADPCQDSPEACAAFVRLVIGGPMLTPDLPKGRRDRFSGDRDSCLDSIGAEDFAEALARIPGVRIGYKRGGIVEWKGEP
jgi:hypothetical protein